jgi:hypothetical protein
MRRRDDSGADCGQRLQMPEEPRIIPMTDNLRGAMWRADDHPRAVVIYFQARDCEEEVSFRVRTSAAIRSKMWRMPWLKGGNWLSLTESLGAHHYAVAIAEKKFLDVPFIVGLELETEGDPRDAVVGADIWDRSGATAQVVFIDFGE